MIVVVNGQPRSGSTLAFNIAKELASRAGRLAEARGSSISEIYEMLAFEHDNPTDTISVYKCHYFIPPLWVEYGMVRLVYTYRNPLDVLASSLRVPDKAAIFDSVGSGPFIGALAFDYSHFLAMLWTTPCWGEHKVMARYEDFYGDEAEGLVLQITDVMGLSDYHSSEILQEIADKFSKEKMRAIGESVVEGEADPETQIRAGHVSDSFGAPGSWRRNLSPELEEVVRTRFKMWMKECFWS